MRTISNSLKNRLSAQAEEASFQGFDKVASTLESKVSSIDTRDDSDEYIYSKSQLNVDVYNLLWDAALRVQDYYNKTADAKSIDDIIVSMSEDLVSSIRKKIGGNVVGPNEPAVPGELRVLVEVE